MVEPVKRGPGRPRKHPKPETKVTFTTKVKNSHELAIEERLAGCGRKEADQIIYVGQLVERTLSGEFGAVIKALTAGRVSAELSANKDSHLSSDRIIGRLEMANNLWDDLEQFVLDKDAQLKPLETQTTQEAYTATSPGEVQRGAETFSFSPD